MNSFGHKVGLGLLAVAALTGCFAARPKVSTLVKQLNSRHSAVQIRAANALAALGPQAQPALPGLLRLFKDTRRPVHDAAANAIASLGEEGMRALSTTLSDPDSWVRCRAAEALGDAGPAAAVAIPDLARALSDHDFCVSGKAAEALGRVGEPAVPALLEALKSDNPAVRKLAADAVSRMSPASQRHVAEDLLPAIRQGDEFESGEAAMRLSSLGKAAVVAFLDLLWDKDPAFRYKAVDGLAEIGDTSPGVVDALAGLFKDPVNTLRLRAAVVLGKWGQKDPAVLDRLIPLLRSPDVDTRRGAVQAIGNMGTAGASAVDALTSIVEDGKDPLQDEAVEALNGIGTRDALRAAENHTRRDYLRRKSGVTPASPAAAPSEN